MEPNLKSVLVPLVRHEFRRRHRRRRQWMSKQWQLAYGLFFLAVILILTTYFSLFHTIQLNYIWFVFLGLPWAMFGLSISRIVREWKGETVGWWLTLPYSRQTLILAKFIAGLMRSLLIALAAYVLIFLFGGYATLISASLSLQDFGVFAESGLYFFLLDICFFPLAIAFGLLYGTLIRTKWRPAVPLFWIVLSIGWGMGWSIGDPSEWIQASGQSLQIPSLPIPAVLIGWVLSGLLIMLAGWLLEKKLDL
ncbi:MULTISPECIES: ABC-2 transporter permease [unclassified Sporolactobacillus]|uniref:ABC-2 transporter permease n=1 Tax=unclassified Sporolactobacillus TaxID=2628533 RepID=UPI002368CF4A|nr:ABC-2 transporter permease [Sporolactobacillus sp. CQH2019]MDD9148356.1 ABC transporter permease subunit [Sporolactobacillus sp. CQH2019]